MVTHARVEFHTANETRRPRRASRIGLLIGAYVLATLIPTLAFAGSEVGANTSPPWSMRIRADFWAASGAISSKLPHRAHMPTQLPVEPNDRDDYLDLLTKAGLVHAPADR
jgi:hypothetical protein